MKLPTLPALAIVLGGLAATPAYGEAPASFSQDPEVREFIIGMHERYGFDVSHLTRQFSAIRPNATVLRAIRPPAFPERQRSWERYRERFVNPQRIAGGESFWQRHAATLQRAEAIYGVPPEVIVAIIGVETIYGQHMGSFGVLEALASLAFRYPPRAEFFRGELEQFLLLARENGISPLEIKGSYAGAIGIPQFMPSSQRLYAVDFDGDDRIDLRRSYADAIGSVARFLNQHGWQKGEPVAIPARVVQDPSELIATGIKPSLTVEELRARGILADGAEADRRAALIDLVSPGEATEYWLGFDNFYVITRYNRSSFYAMAVFQLAEALRDSRSRFAANR
ncbi:lytic murein transglycosylase B [Accumulibacter sp.]|uniref:lytic murein transglycosylase B n=1 Tax=Accumulibacter sp. TaxID=2053492 RepID=UPI0025D2803D|nr:lytic murein transglycosylase B [Accumulibacter sp.]MCM8596756.1 lytic murein transglycosylase B [Accumulibacter sp.]MCM8624710.1 lytic murein transglycosylase B [Accumulibacter sp.]MDS4050905.1 lytic murein transglycosylase B [Accumulibacter sp.]